MLVNSKNEIRARVQQFVEQQMQTTMVSPSRPIPDHQRLWVPVECGLRPLISSS